MRKSAKGRFPSPASSASQKSEKQAKSGPPKVTRVVTVPPDVAAVRKQISAFFSATYDSGTLGNAYGVYAFFDYDGEPIYVGQTHEGLRSRVGRHLTNQRTDAVAMSVLDPFEVAEIEVWPLPLAVREKPNRKQLRKSLDDLEFSVFQRLLRNSKLNAILNEKDPNGSQLADLPSSFRARIVPDGLYEQRQHPDVRIARRAATIARLAHIISERDVSAGLRRTLLTQAARLEKLARERFEPFANKVQTKSPGEETGEEIE